MSLVIPATFRYVKCGKQRNGALEARKNQTWQMEAVENADFADGARGGSETWLPSGIKFCALITDIHC